MILRDFNKAPSARLKTVSKFLYEQFSVSVKGVPPKNKLEKLIETANNRLVDIRISNKKFQLEADYAKFLGLREAASAMLEEGMYAESPRFVEMKNMIRATVERLMDSGYSMEEACGECMHSYRRDSNFEWPEEVVLPIILTAAEDYVQSCKMESQVIEDVVNSNTHLSDRLLRELAKECGVSLTESGAIDVIKEKLEMFAKATGKTVEAVTGFLNSLDDKALPEGIKMFGRKIAKRNRLNSHMTETVSVTDFNPKSAGGTRKALLAKYKKTKDPKDATAARKAGATQKELHAALNEDAKDKMFEDIINEILSEGVDVEQAEVVMAVRALADDLQGQIERVGRMINEDIPAIADQMRSEMGANEATSFSSSATQTLSSHLESIRATKDALDQQIAALTGDAPMAMSGLDSAPSLGDDTAGLDDLDLGDDSVDNVPPAEGPKDAPLGRARI